MKQIIELNKEDIVRLVTKEFDVKKEQVKVYLDPVYIGYGIGEDKAYELRVTVNK